MFVALDFLSNGQTYRIKREFTSLQGKSTANLDFAVLEKDSGIFKALTDKTIRQTQEKIEQIIGLNYDAFINSAFLRQGQSNEFSKKSPKERKEILASILGLEKYENLRKAAIEKLKLYSLEKQNLAKLQEHINNELTQKENLNLKINNLQDILEKIEQEDKSARRDFLAIQTEKEILSMRDQESKLVKFALNQLETNINNQIIEFKNLVSIFRSILRNRRSLSYNKNIEIEKTELELQNLNLQKLAQQRLTLQEEYLRQKELLQLICQKIQEEHSKIVQAQQLEIKSAEISYKNLENQLTQAKNELAKTNNNIQKINPEINKVSFEIFLEDIKKHEKKLLRLKNFYQKFKLLKNQLINESRLIAEKLDLIQNSSSCCPLCDQSLLETQRNQIAYQFNTKKSLVVHQINRLETVLYNLEQNIIIEDKVYNKSNSLIEEYKNYHNLNELEKKLSADIALQTSLLVAQANLINQLNIKANELNNKTNNIFQNSLEYVTVEKKLKELVEVIKSINYDQAHHNKINQRLQEIYRIQQEHNTLQQEIALQENRKLNIHSISITLKKLKSEKRSLEEKFKEYENVAAKIIELEKQINQINLKIEAISKEKENIARLQGNLQAQQKQIEKIEEDFKRNFSQINLLAIAIDDYQILSTALSKDGLQALLIEDSIPEIEQEANYLLSKLTDNQAQIIIESIKDLKSGGTKETLDIKISDPAGIRAYEMFSGGEAFRIDLALRISISKLLAKKAGTALETLIIDEGFGSQDEDGLNNIMETIYKIQDDFAKIIIVSHLGQMKEQFPVHFIVNKGASGSIVNVFEQG